MNRHLIDYSALPHEALGTPRRPEPAKPQDGPWKPLSPGYESRTLAGGAVEVRSTGVSAQDLKQYVEPEKKAGESIITPLVPSAGVVADAPTEWQDGPPPSVGWWPTSTKTARHFDGLRWSVDTYIDGASAIQRQNLMRLPAVADQQSIRWRGPRLVGAAWPEPQA